MYTHHRVPLLLTPQTDIPGESKFEAFMNEMQSIRESLCEDGQVDEEPSEGGVTWGKRKYLALLGRVCVVCV